MRWDPEAYLQFADERARPFVDLMSRVGAQHVQRVVDLGCGPGNLTRLLAARWAEARVTGIDSSAEMVARAQAEGEDAHLSFAHGDLRDWAADEPVDVLVSNATLQWVPEHLRLLPRLVAQVRPGGWFAFQVPGNFGAITHTAITELVAAPRWGDRLAGAVIEWPRAEDPGAYLQALVDAGCRVDVWETTYLQVLTGPDAVVRWMSGTGLRPVLAALDESERDEFLDDYRRRVAEVYPAHDWGTALPYRRIFAVTQRGVR